MSDKNERAIKVVAENRKARFNYAIEDTIEAGLALTGTEVKSIRSGKTTIAESYADSRDGEIWLINQLKRHQEAAPAAPPKPSREEELLTEIRDILKKA